MLQALVARSGKRIYRAKLRLPGHASWIRPFSPGLAQYSNISPKDGSSSGGDPVKKNASGTIASAIKGTVASLVDIVKNPGETWKTIKEVANHYWLGSKLLWSDIKVARQILGRILEGHAMTRRERMQLVRTSTDIFRLVPFSIFVIVPFMELLLPFALKMFPNMLPSTFQDSLKAEETMKKELQMRLAVANFMRETMQQMAEKKQKLSSSGDKEAASGAKEVIDFVEKARLGEHIPNDQVLRIARLFKEELTLANVPRPQLVSMCQYMGLQPYGADSFLRFQLRAKLRALQEDDKRILWEGIDSLNTIELRDACRERGMRSIGMTQFRLKKQLEEWLELSTQKGIPIFLLIMSRAFMLNASSGVGEDRARPAGAPGRPEGLAAHLPSDPDQVLQSSMSFLDADTINEVVLDAASSGEVDTPEMRRRRLESIEFQKELMEEERQEQVGAAKTKQQAAAPTLLHGSVVQAQGSASSIQPRPEEKVGDRQALASKTPAGPPLPQQQDSAHTADIVAVVPQPAALVEVRDGASTAFSSSPATEGTPSSEADGKHQEDGKAELTIHELVALSDLARGNSLRREMSELAVLEAFIESLPIDAASSSSTPSALSSGAGRDAVVVEPFSADGWGEVLVHPAPSKGDAKGTIQTTTASEPSVKERAEEPEDRSVKMMKSAISAMVSKLKVRIDTTEKVLGDKLRMLDSDGDGQISFDEIKEVTAAVMKKGPATEGHVAQLFQVLDSNKDGKVSVAELLQYIQRKKESREVEELEAQMKAAAAAAALARATPLNKIDAAKPPTQASPVASEARKD